MMSINSQILLAFYVTASAVYSFSLFLLVKGYEGTRDLIQNPMFPFIFALFRTSLIDCELEADWISEKQCRFLFSITDILFFKSLFLFHLTKVMQYPLLRCFCVITFSIYFLSYSWSLPPDQSKNTFRIVDNLSICLFAMVASLKNPLRLVSNNALLASQLLLLYQMHHPINKLVHLICTFLFFLLWDITFTISLLRSEKLHQIPHASPIHNEMYFIDNDDFPAPRITQGVDRSRQTNGTGQTNDLVPDSPPI